MQTCPPWKRINVRILNFVSYCLACRGCFFFLLSQLLSVTLSIRCLFYRWWGEKHISYWKICHLVNQDDNIKLKRSNNNSCWLWAWTRKFRASDSFQSCELPTKYRKAGQSQQRGSELEGRSICEMAVKATSLKFLEVGRATVSKALPVNAGSRILVILLK